MKGCFALVEASVDTSTCGFKNQTGEVKGGRCLCRRLATCAAADQS